MSGYQVKSLNVELEREARSWVVEALGTPYQIHTDSESEHLALGAHDSSQTNSLGPIPWNFLVGENCCGRSTVFS